MDESYEFFYDYLSNGLFKIFIEIYNDSKKIKSPYNYLKNFQLSLGETTKWSDVVYEKKWEFISKQSNCEYFDDYLKIIFYTKLKYLIENCIYQIKDNENIDLSNYVSPSNIEFLKKVTVYSAREFYKNPYLFDDRNLSSKRIVKNRVITKDILLKSIKYIIQLSLPTKLFVNHYDPKELIRKVNDIQNRMTELNSMNRSKYLTANTADCTITQNDKDIANTNTTLIVNDKNNTQNMNDPNSLVQLYQTMLLNQLMQQQQNMNQNIPTIQQSPILKQTTISANSDSESDNSESEKNEKSKSKQIFKKQLKKEIRNNNQSKKVDIQSTQSAQSAQSAQLSSESSDNLNDESNHSLHSNESNVDDDIDEDVNSSDSESEKSHKNNNNVQVQTYSNKQENLDKIHLSQLSNQIKRNHPIPNESNEKPKIQDTNELQNDTRLLMKKEQNVPNNNNQVHSNNNNTSVIKIKIDEDDLKLNNNFYNKESDKNKINENSKNISVNGLSSQTHIEMAKYTSKSYRHKLKSMNQNLKKNMNNNNVVDKLQSNLKNISKKHQKLNDDTIYVHKGDKNNKLQKRQLDIVRSITSQHTNFQSLSDNENDNKSSIIEKKLNTIKSQNVNKVFLNK